MSPLLNSNSAPDIVVKQDVDKQWPLQVHETFVAFVLYWLLFVANDAKAAWRTFRHAASKDWAFTVENIRNLILEYETDGEAQFIPRRGMLLPLREQVKKGGHALRSYTERFTAADDNIEHKPGEALRVLSTSDVRYKRALMWLQRTYIVEQWPAYDPTSDRDEDLPIDLDHIVPQSVFSFDWRNKDRFLEGDAISDNFRWRRSTVGNSLGNFRWLAASDNRKRGKGEYEPLPGNGDLVSNPGDSNSIIVDLLTQPWSKNNIATFQRIIDLRTVELYEKILTESGIENILPPLPDLSTAESATK